MALLIFHLVLSSFTFEGVDIRMAQKILDYHIQRYPNGTYHVAYHTAVCSLFLHCFCLLFYVLCISLVTGVRDTHPLPG